METMEDVVGILNHLLSAEVFDDQLLERSINRFTELCEQKPAGSVASPESMNNTIHPGIVLMDFEMHSEKKKEEIRLLKVEQIQQQNFEYAANMRDEEKECITYLKFKKHYGLEKSAFVIIEGFLIYAYFGTANNDQLIRGILEKGDRLKSMKIN